MKPGALISVGPKDFSVPNREKKPNQPDVAYQIFESHCYASKFYSLLSYRKALYLGIERSPLDLAELNSFQVVFNGGHLISDLC